MYHDRLLLPLLWRKHYGTPWRSKEDAEADREELAELIELYYEACRMSRGKVEARNNHWKEIATHLQRGLWRRLERDP